MILKILFSITLFSLVLLAAQRLFFSFAAQAPADYAGTGPTFDPQRHLAGDMLSEGVIFGPSGRVSSRFTARMNGEWTNSGGTLSEDFTFDTGALLQREWTIISTGVDSFTATAPDIEGQAIGEISGATLQMTYRLRLGEAAGGHVVNVIDWLYLTEGGVILNKSEMRKFGIKVAELVATIRPAD